MSARAFVLALLMCPLAAHSQEATTLLYHGKVITVDPQFRVVDSMAIRGDRIVGIGVRQEVAEFAGPNTVQIDLQGKTVLPGLVDSHVHAADAAMYEFDHPVPTMETIADALGYIKSRAAVDTARVMGDLLRDVSTCLDKSPLITNWSGVVTT